MTLKALVLAVAGMSLLGMYSMNTHTGSGAIVSQSFPRSRLLQQTGQEPIPPSQGTGATNQQLAGNLSSVAPATEVSTDAAPATEVGRPVPGPTGEPISASTALFIAVRNRNVARIDQLFREGASTDVYSTSGTTPLLEAIEMNAPAVIQAILAKGVDTNLASKPQGVTPLALAVQRGNVALATRLLDAGADINLKDAMGDTVLIRAVKQRPPNYAAIQLLLSRRPSPTTSAADLTATDAEGRTAQEIAQATGDPRLIALFAAAPAPESEPMMGPETAAAMPTAPAGKAAGAAPLPPP